MAGFSRFGENRRSWRSYILQADKLFVRTGSERITSGPLVGMESRIKKINRHKREALVEMEVMGAVREVRVMLEVVGKV